MTKVSTTKVSTHAPPKRSLQLSFSLPTAMLVGGVLLIAASFLPLGNWAAKLQWTPTDSAAYDQVSNEYKISAYKSPARAGLSQGEWDAQRGRMQQQMQALQQRLDRAKGQPRRWGRYLMGVGTLLTVVGFFAHSVRQSG